ncbi:helical backbone metal receptor [Thermaurantimonas aggregans]|uniref:helical backbone metal receptor n=1 Tax=Thermaurantimonas aggregans TaxID=2173829 RepID=UPI0023F3CE0C|nr:helical backbone metal receptor [Thermaurantimonas aggregans]MCX8148812.1 helical backbone metal receptor [Thermaurantimonas aggregans]
MRVVSLVPSLTELLYHLGVDVVGITKFCVHPEEWYRTKPRVGGTKNPDINRIKELKPDLILANKEENRKEDVEQLRQFSQVLVTNITTINDALEAIRLIGRVCNVVQAVEKLVHSIIELWKPLQGSADGARVLYLIWRKPYMAAGTDTYIHHVLQHLGFSNAVNQSRYPVVDEKSIRLMNPELIFLSSEPYPFREKHLAEFQGMAPTAHVRLVDGEAFSWYGYRMIPAASYFYLLIHDINEMKR